MAASGLQRFATALQGVISAWDKFYQTMPSAAEDEEFRELQVARSLLIEYADSGVLESPSEIERLTSELAEEKKLSEAVRRDFNNTALELAAKAQALENHANSKRAKTRVKERTVLTPRSSD